MMENITSIPVCTQWSVHEKRSQITLTHAQECNPRQPWSHRGRSWSNAQCLWKRCLALIFLRYSSRHALPSPLSGQRSHWSKEGVCCLLSVNAYVVMVQPLMGQACWYKHSAWQKRFRAWAKWRKPKYVWESKGLIFQSQCCIHVWVISSVFSTEFLHLYPVYVVAEAIPFMKTIEIAMRKKWIFCPEHRSLDCSRLLHWPPNRSN